MNTSLTTAVVSASLLAAVWIGIWLRRLLPPPHLSADTKDTVKLTMGLVATMSALLLGLLVNSGKASYDTKRGQVIQMASKVALLDRVLVLGVYGPEGAEVRRQLRTLVEEQMRRMWPGEPSVPAQLKSPSQTGDAFYAAIQTLAARDDTQRALKAQAVSLTVEFAQLRSLMLAQSSTSIAIPVLVMVVCWLLVIFLGFTLIAPPNATANLALMVSALCAAAAIFLIMELDRPFGGLIQISSEPMRKALSQLGKWGL